MKVLIGMKDIIERIAPFARQLEFLFLRPHRQVIEETNHPLLHPSHYPGHIRWK